MLNFHNPTFKYNFRLKKNMRNFVVAALIGSSAVQSIKLNSRFVGDVKTEWKGSSNPIEWRSHGEYDTTSFE